MVKFTLTQAGLVVGVRSPSHPQSLIQFECGFDADLAFAGVEVATEELNRRFDDHVDPRAGVQAVKDFFATNPQVRCQFCGWRDKKSRKCTQHDQPVNDTGVCKLFCHVHEVEF